MSPIDTESVSRPRRPARQYKCDHCDKAFKRSEHCIRHERSHTREKPFSCRYCRKSYARKDLVTRHERTLHADRHPPKPECTSSKIQVSSGSPTSEADNDDDPEESNSQQSVRDAPALVQAVPAIKMNANATNTTPGNGVAVANMDLEVEMEESRQYVQETMTTPISLASEHAVSSRRVSLASTFQPDLETPGSDQQPNSASENILPQQCQSDLEDQPMNFEQNPQDGFSNLPMNGAAPTNKETSPSNMPGFDMPPFPDSIFEMPPDFFSLDVSDFLGLQNPTAMYQDIPTDAISTNPQTDVIDGPTSDHSSLPIPDRVQRRLPRLSEDKRPKTPTFDLNQDTHDLIWRDLAERLLSQCPTNEIPPAKACQGFLGSYIECFHVHLPIIHLPTLCLNTTPSPLVLAMCSIGALYRLQHRHARRLYDITIQALKLDSSSSKLFTASMDERPLWLMQTKVLLTYFAFLSGDNELVSYAWSDYGLFALVYGKIRLSLIEEETDLATITWAKWIQRESWKRLLGGMFVASTLSMVIYDMNPGFSATQDLELEMFHDESIWNATTVNEWREARSKSRKVVSRTMKDALADIVSDSKNEFQFEPYHLSTFSALIIMHGVVVHMWHLFQFAHIFLRDYSSAEPEQPLNGPQLINSALQSLERCQDLLKHNLNINQEDLHHNSHTSLTFNCQAILRIAHVRLFNAAIGFNRLSLIAHDIGAIELSISMFVSSKLTRSAYLLNAVERSFDAFRIPMKVGHMLVRKTAAFSWGIEHAVAGWDCALFVTKWVHSVEMDALNGIEPSFAEKTLLASMGDVLKEADFDPDEGKSLAACLASMWSFFFGDVWVWGVTPRMGSILERLATAYQRVNEASRG